VIGLHFRGQCGSSRKGVVVIVVNEDVEARTANKELFGEVKTSASLDPK
jgi:hypothetical protein